MKSAKKKACKCCGCLTVKGAHDIGGRICPVCFWAEDIFSRGKDSPSGENLGLTVSQAQENYRQFGAFDKSALPYVREPNDSELTETSLETAGYPDGRTEDSWQNVIIGEMPSDSGFIVVSTSSNSYSAACYSVDNGHYERDHRWMQSIGGDSVHDKYKKHFELLTNTPGLHFIQYENGRTVSSRVFSEPEFFSNLYDGYETDVIFEREYGLRPSNEDKQADIEKAVKKAERTRKTLLYACKTGDTARIIELAAKASAAQLNKAEPRGKTAIGFCAANDDFEGFKAMAEAGADITKKVAAMNAFGWAKHASPRIVLYIHDNFPPFFDEQTANGFVCRGAAGCDDRETLERLTDAGMLLDTEVNLYGSPEPFLFAFVEMDNSAGVQLMYDKGFDLAEIRERHTGRNAVEEAEICGIDNKAYRLLKELISS